MGNLKFNGKDINPRDFEKSILDEVKKQVSNEIQQVLNSFTDRIEAEGGRIEVDLKEDDKDNLNFDVIGHNVSDELKEEVQKKISELFS